MRRSATCSERVRRAGATLFVLAALFAAGAGSAPAGVLVEAEAALKRVFPAPLVVAKKTAFLDAAQAARVEQLAGQALPSKVVAYYAATDPATGKPAGWAFVDTHIVRTLPETVLVVLDPAGRVSRVEILSFNEPPEYMLTAPWLAQLGGRALDDELRLQRGIRTMAGATLSSGAMTDAVRRVLALHQVLEATP
jgi:electron transport complex protein RnfG